jgi:hypothetical protein
MPEPVVRAFGVLKRAAAKVRPRRPRARVPGRLAARCAAAGEAGRAGEAGTARSSALGLPAAAARLTRRPLPLAPRSTWRRVCWTPKSATPLCRCSARGEGCGTEQQPTGPAPRRRRLPPRGPLTPPGQPPLSRPRPPSSRRAGGDRGGGRQAVGPLPAGDLADRQRHAVQHERQRGGAWGMGWRGWRWGAEGAPRCRQAMVGSGVHNAPS